MRDLPDGITIEPMPLGFSTPITDDGRVLRAAVRIKGDDYELGLRPPRDEAALRIAKGHLVAGIWQLLELHRLGANDLMQYAWVHRHKNKARSAPLTAPSL